MLHYGPAMSSGATKVKSLRMLQVPGSDCSHSGRKPAPDPNYLLPTPRTWITSRRSSCGTHFVLAKDCTTERIHYSRVYSKQKSLGDSNVTAVWTLAWEDALSGGSSMALRIERRYCTVIGTGLVVFFLQTSRGWCYCNNPSMIQVLPLGYVASR